MTLREKVLQEIRERGAIPFSRYMEMCLYDSDLGYYSRNAEKFGKAGDFYTSSDVHAVFGRLLARQFEEMWRTLGAPPQIEILELGPGRGLFAQDVLAWSEKKFPRFFRALLYSLYESSPSLRVRINETLRERLEAGKAVLLDIAGNKMVRALKPETPILVFANEFFDALPVEIVSTQGKLEITAKENNLAESWVRVSAEENQYLDLYSFQPEGRERAEVSFRALESIREAADLIRQGFVIVIDYGYTQKEQLTGRHRGTLKAIRQHSISANPYEAPGEQDITTEVNFNALAAAGEAAGLAIQSLVTQSQFLMGIGEANQFADAFEDCKLPQERAKVALQLKQLVTPAGMGESFHVMVGSKGVESEAVVKLSGLSFGRR